MLLIRSLAIKMWPFRSIAFSSSATTIENSSQIPVNASSVPPAYTTPSSISITTSPSSKWILEQTPSKSTPELSCRRRANSDGSVSYLLALSSTFAAHQLKHEKMIEFVDLPDVRHLVVFGRVLDEVYLSGSLALSLFRSLNI